MAPGTECAIVRGEYKVTPVGASGEEGHGACSVRASSTGRLVISARRRWIRVAAGTYAREVLKRPARCICWLLTYAAKMA